jgi:hypothetical protein
LRKLCIWYQVARQPSVPTLSGQVLQFHWNRAAHPHEVLRCINTTPNPQQGRENPCQPQRTRKGRESSFDQLTSIPGTRRKASCPTTSGSSTYVSQWSVGGTPISQVTNMRSQIRTQQLAPSLPAKGWLRSPFEKLRLVMEG